MPAAFGLVINKRKEILLIQRGYGRQCGKWSLPGGNQDKGESLKETARRETLEETGIRMTVDLLYHKSEKHRFEVWFGKQIGGRLKVQKRECLDASWFSSDMLPHDENLAFGIDVRVLGKWVAENNGSRRVHYPSGKMNKAGFALVVNNLNEVLMVQRRRGNRAGKWSLPGAETRRSERQREAAVRGTYEETGIIMDPRFLFYDNRHNAGVWLGTPLTYSYKLSNGRWFSVDQLPDVENLAYAIDVSTIGKWLADNNEIRPDYLRE